MCLLPVTVVKIEVASSRVSEMLSLKGKSCVDVNAL
jgi:hypothetical protein